VVVFHTTHLKSESSTFLLTSTCDENDARRPRPAEPGQARAIRIGPAIPREAVRAGRGSGPSGKRLHLPQRF